MKLLFLVRNGKQTHNPAKTEIIRVCLFAGLIQNYYDWRSDSLFGFFDKGAHRKFNYNI